MFFNFSVSVVYVFHFLNNIHILIVFGLKSHSLLCLLNTSNYPLLHSWTVVVRAVYNFYKYVLYGNTVLKEHKAQQTFYFASLPTLTSWVILSANVSMPALPSKLLISFLAQVIGRIEVPINFVYNIFTLMKLFSHLVFTALVSI